MNELANESLPALVVLLLCLMELRHWQSVIRYEKVVASLLEEIACLRPAHEERPR